MAKYYWKGTAAGFTTGVTGASYDAWISATSVGLTKNWAYSIGTIGSGVTGATALPGSNDLVYISDRFPTIGSTLAGATGGSYTYVLSPCLNSSNVGITASYLYLGPWSNQSVSGLPLVDTFGFGRVGGPTLGNAAISETAGVTAANLVGYQMQCRVANTIWIYDNDLGAYDINLKVAGVTATKIQPKRVSPSGSPFAGESLDAFTLAQKPWKLQTALRVSGNMQTLLFDQNFVLGTLRMYPDFSLTPLASGPHGTGLTASAPLKLIGQIFNTEQDYSTTSGSIPYVEVYPRIRCFDEAAAGTYIFGGSILRTGATDTISSRNGIVDCSCVSASRNEATGVSGFTSGVPHAYQIVLGTHPTEAEPAASTTQRFGIFTNELTSGCPHVKLRGTVILKDFYMNTGTMRIDPTSVTGQQGVIIQNGYVFSDLQNPVDLGGDVRLTPYNDDMIPASGVAAIRQTTSYGLYVDPEYATTSVIRYPLGAVFETHTDNPNLFG